ncbi:unnamed protein product [Phytophthora fragariaefolia]|uniref:Unnamed protein product n=1 Tax=Phytophthora fragariaefolia TaxID=1490495 RepID=A0A9W6YLT4_9STRA|nr:unnamed protein product [Phytophthora fragariaefolia]
MKDTDGDAPGKAMVKAIPTSDKLIAAVGKKNEKGKTAVLKPPRGRTKAGKKTHIFWDSDGVDGEKFSFWCVSTNREIVSRMTLTV